jgi:hypothetical protein
MTSLLDKWRLLQAIIAEPDLSPAAKFVAVRLLDHANSRTGRCSPSYDTIARGIGLTRRRVIDGVKELEAAGWISVSRSTHAGARETGRPLASNHFAFDWSRLEGAASAVFGNKASEENCTSGGEGDPGLVQETSLASEENFTGLVKKTSPKTFNRNHQDKPGRETSFARGRADGQDAPPKSVRGRKTGRKPEADPPPATEASRSRSKRLGNEELAAAFERTFWPHYPRRKGKQAALKAYRRVVQEGLATPEKLQAAAMRYAAERDGQDPKFTSYPGNWLNDGSYDDEPDPVAPRRKPSAQDAARALQHWVNNGSRIDHIAAAARGYVGMDDTHDTDEDDDRYEDRATAAWR